MRVRMFLFHLLVLLTENNISIEEIVDELKKRSGVSGLEENPIGKNNGFMYLLQNY